MEAFCIFCNTSLSKDTGQFQITDKNFAEAINIFGELLKTEIGCGVIPKVVQPLNSSSDTSRSPNIPVCKSCINRIQKVQSLKQVIDEANKELKQTLSNLVDDVVLKSISPKDFPGQLEDPSIVKPTWARMRKALVNVSVRAHERSQKLLPGSVKAAVVGSRHPKVVDVVDSQPLDGQNPELQYLTERVVGNHTILANIFEQVPDVVDLKMCRLVSRLWRNQSLTVWRSRAKIRLHGRNGGGNKSDAVSLEDIRSNQNPYFYRMQDVPFNSYVIQEPIRFPLNYQLDDLVWFFEYIGVHITYIHLNSIVFEGARCLQGLHDLLVRFCPNLKEIKLNPWVKASDRQDVNVNVDVRPGAKLVNSNLRTWEFPPEKNRYDSNAPYMDRKIDLLVDNPELMERFLKMIPNLKVLKSRNSLPATDLLTSLSTTIHNGAFIQLSVLEISSSVLTRTDLANLSYYLEIAQPKLKSMYIKIFVSHLKKESTEFTTVLKLTRQTLENLQIDIRNENRCTTPTWIDVLMDLELSELTSLKIVWEMDNIIPFDFCSLNCTHNLTSFHYVKGELNLDHSNEIPMTYAITALSDDLIVKQQPFLEKLTSFSYASRFSDDCFVLLKNIMPNVCKLNIMLNEVDAPSAFHAFPNAIDFVATATNTIYIG